MGWVHGWVAGCINRAHDLACITTICDAEQLYTNASTRVAKAAIDLHLHCVVDLMSTLQMGRINHAHACTHARSCEEADLASLTWTYHAEQLYTDAALVLDASTRVAAAAGSSLIDLHLHCVVDLADLAGRINRVHARSCEEVDLASPGWI